AAPSINLDGVNKDELVETEDHEALTFLKDVTDKMGLSITVKAKIGENIVYLEIDGKDSGTVIGKRGQTLDAIQYLTS
ncbi:MAG: KH domain-containing protein, partial [Bacillota bacterium]|nr:KH domain-containing protein [Bacillota bacterium]